MWKKIKLLSLIAFCSCLTACQIKQTDSNAIVCTTTIVADILQNIAPPTLAIMGPGTDPHLYQSKSGDHIQMNNANIIAYSGLHLEGKLNDVLDHMRAQKNVICLSDGIPSNKLISSADFGGASDPHFWFDVDLIKACVKHSASELVKFRPNDSLAIHNNTSNYLQKLDSAAANWQKIIDQIPVEKRILITAHDAFNYFGKKYQFTVKGVQGASTAAEAGLKDITLLVDFIVQHQVKAIFVESSVSERNIKAIIEGCAKKGHKVNLGGTLYSDALGEKNGTAGTYLKMMEQNIKTIVESLQN